MSRLTMNDRQTVSTRHVNEQEGKFQCSTVEPREGGRGGRGGPGSWVLDLSTRGKEAKEEEKKHQKGSDNVKLENGGVIC